MMNTLYKERFPKATRQMEERLSHFIEENKTFDGAENCDSLPIVRFVHHQVLEMARDCLHKSQAKLITSRYFYEMSENLERLLLEVLTIFTINVFNFLFNHFALTYVFAYGSCFKIKHKIKQILFLTRVSMN